MRWSSKEAAPMQRLVAAEWKDVNIEQVAICFSHTVTNVLLVDSVLLRQVYVEHYLHHSDTLTALV